MSAAVMLWFLKATFPPVGSRWEGCVSILHNTYDGRRGKTRRHKPNNQIPLALLNVCCIFPVLQGTGRGKKNNDMVVFSVWVCTCKDSTFPYWEQSQNKSWFNQCQPFARPWPALSKPTRNQMAILPFPRSHCCSVLHFELNRKQSCCWWLVPFSLASRINLISMVQHSGMAARLLLAEGIRKHYARGCRGMKQSIMYHCLGILCLSLVAPNSLIHNFFPDNVQFQRSLHVSERP